MLVVLDLQKSKVQPRSGDLVVAVRTQSGLREVTAKRLVVLNHDIELRHGSNDPRYTDPHQASYMEPIRFRAGSTAIDRDTKIEIIAIVKAAYRQIG